MRRFSDPVQVRVSVRPEAFVWRGRVYLVQDVLGHWRERRSWWRDALEDPAGEPVTLEDAAAEAEVWRVQASPGRCSSPGVYDLRQEAAGRDEWRLVRVAD